MHLLLRFRLSVALVAMSILTGVGNQAYGQNDESAGDEVRHFLYVATPGIRNYLEYGGHGILVFDMDEQHRFVRRIPLGGLNEEGKPLNVKGICASAQTNRVWVSTIRTLMCLDLTTDALLWERSYDGGCDRMSVTPDGRVIYLPSLEKGHWHVVDGLSGDVLARIEPKSGAHNTIVGPDGRFAYLAGLRSPVLTIAETSTHTVAKACGPFSNNIRPFTINSAQTRVYVCINDCLGFEIGDLNSGRKLFRVEVDGFQKGKVKRHGCPSHGIGLTPDESELWVTDGHNSRMHIFDATVEPPTQIESIPVRDQPGWVTFSIDGKWAYPSSGEVIERATRRTVALLTDEDGNAVGSEKMLQVDFAEGKPNRTGDQFGIGRRTRTD